MQITFIMGAAPRKNSGPNADHLLSHSTVANSNLPILTPEICSILGEVFLQRYSWRSCVNTWAGIISLVTIAEENCLVSSGGCSDSTCWQM